MDFFLLDVWFSFQLDALLDSKPVEILIHMGI